MSVPYYPQSRYTVNLGLSLFGMDEVLAENFVILDTSIGSGGGGGGTSTIKVNGSVVTNPNFNDTTPAAPLGFTNVKWQKDGSGNVSAYVSSTSGGTPAFPFTSVQFNDAGAFGGNSGFTFNKTAVGLGVGPLSTPGTNPDDPGSVATITSDVLRTDPAHQVYGVTSTVNLDPTGDMATYVIGVASQVTIKDTSTHNFTDTEIGVGAGYFETDNNGSGDVNILFGLNVNTFANNGGAVTNMYGLNVLSQSFGSGIITNNSGIIVNSGQGSGGGTIVNNIGIDIKKGAGGSVTNQISLLIDTQLGTSSTKAIYILNVGTGANDYAIVVEGGKSYFGRADLSGVLLAGSSSGVISVLTQAASGTFNFNLPITAGSAGQVLTSQGGGATAMTWTNPSTPTVATVHLTGQIASIGSTTLYAVTPSDTISISYYLKITTAGSTSGSVTLALGWTDRDDSTVLSVVIPTPTNAVDTTGVVSGTLVVDAKTGTNITYLTTYASSGGTAMVYKLSLKAEAL